MTFYGGRPAPRVPRFSNLRTVLALPLIFIALVLYFFVASIMLAVDAISGRPLSRDLLG